MLAILAEHHLDTAAVLAVVAEFVLRLLPLVSRRASRHVVKLAKARNRRAK